MSKLSHEKSNSSLLNDKLNPTLGRVEESKSNFRRHRASQKLDFGVESWNWAGNRPFHYTSTSIVLKSEMYRIPRVQT